MDFLSRLMDYKVPNRVETREVSEEVSPFPTPWVGDYINSHHLSPEHLTPILNTRGNILVASCAGSGKTTALSLKVLHDLSRDTWDNPAKVWVGTFLRTGSQDLYDRISSIFRDPEVHVPTLSGVSISTIHSEFYHLASQILGFTPEIVSESRDIAMLKSLEPDFNVGTRAVEVYNYLNRYSNSLGEVDPFPSMTFTVDTEALLYRWRTARVAASMWNHNDVQDFLLDKLRTSSDIQALVASRYDRIYLDEFQDVSKAQYEILKYYFADSTYVVVGDDDQTIYSWRGSDVSIISRTFQEDFSPTLLTLPVNYRTPATILDSVIPSIQHNPGRIPKNISAFNSGGDLSVTYGSVTQLSRTLSAGLENDYRNNLSSVVLVRVNSDGVLPAFLAAVHPSMTFKVSGGIVPDTPMVRAAKGVMEMFRNYPDTKLIEPLMNILFRSTNRETRRIVEFASNQGTSFMDVLLNTPYDDIKYSAPKLLDLAYGLRKYQGLLDDLESALKIINTMMILAYRDTPRRQQLAALISHILIFSQEMGYTTPLIAGDRLNIVWDRITSTESVVNPDVVISTVHGYKGLEADSVYLWHDTEGVFPYQTDQPQDLYEERRIHYIACTRARKALHLLSWEDAPSRFLGEMVLPEPSLAGTLAPADVPEDTPIITL